MREAPSIKIVKSLLAGGMRVSVYDPVAMENSKRIFGRKVEYASDIADSLRGADCCCIATEWEEFKAVPSSLFLEAMAHPIIIDGRRVLDPSKLGPKIVYRAIGSGKPTRELW